MQDARCDRAPGALGVHGGVVEVIIVFYDDQFICDVMTAPEPQPSSFDHVVYHHDVTPLREDEIVWQVPTAAAERSQEL